MKIFSQRKLFAARRNHFIPGHLPTPFTNNTSLGLKSKRLDYLRKPSSAFLLANKASLDKVKFLTKCEGVFKNSKNKKINLDGKSRQHYFKNTYFHANNKIKLSNFSATLNGNTSKTSI